MKLSLLNQLTNCNDESEVKEDLSNFNEIPTIKYEQLDQLRCYIDLAVLFFDEYTDLLNAGKEDFLTNYEHINDFVTPNIKKTFDILNYDPYINIGLELYEFLHNSLIIKKVSITEEISVDDLIALFNNVCINGEEITNKFICLLLFFELCDLKDNNMINIAKLIYAIELYELTLNNEQILNEH